MDGLAEEIRKSDTVISDPNYSAFCTAVNNSGLEGAIDTVNLLPETLKEIRRVVWETVNEKDLLYFDQHQKHWLSLLERYLPLLPIK